VSTMPAPAPASSSNYALWSDDPADVDLLAFDAVAATVAGVLLDEALDPVALGLSGSWGSGKTTILRLVEAEFDARSEEKRRVLVIKTEPWRYDPATGAKESLIGEILTRLEAEVSESKVEENVKNKALDLAQRLVRRVDWAKAIKLTAKTSLALQIPSVDQIFELVKPATIEGQEPEERGLDGFRSDFSDLVNSEALGHVSSVVVLVDDLDRCLPETVIETLEAIRLFLSVPRMSFVIAADEERVAEAIATRFKETGVPEPTAEQGETPSQLYLHKIVQTTIPVPALSRFDTQAFLLLLQLQHDLTAEQVSGLIAQCGDIRRAGGTLDGLQFPDGTDLAEEIAFASRLTPILYEKLGGNPRRIKRFLNDLRVRQAIADRRGIALQAPIVAKLMVLEKLLSDDFETLLGWLANGTLRDQLIALEAASGQAGEQAPFDEAEAKPLKEATKVDEEPKSKDDAKATKAEDQAATVTPIAAPTPKISYSEGLRRWAKLPPALGGQDISPYLFLAAAFAGAPLLDEALPESLRDIASNLLSRSDQRAVTDDNLRALPATEADKLLTHLGRTARDQPSKQAYAAAAIMRIATAQPERLGAAAKALAMIPAEDLRPGTVVHFEGQQPDEYAAVLRTWLAGSDREAIKNGLRKALGEG
jgi:hypothetical protein